MATTTMMVILTKSFFSASFYSFSGSEPYSTNSDRYVYNTRDIYTFNFYQHTLNLLSFQLELGMMKYDLSKLLGARPLQFSAVAWDPAGLSGPEGWDANHNAANDNTREGYSSNNRPLSRLGRLRGAKGAKRPRHWPLLWDFEIYHQKSMQVMNNNNKEKQGKEKEKRGLLGFKKWWF
jgi:hypothetical protein